MSPCGGACSSRVPMTHPMPSQVYQILALCGAPAAEQSTRFRLGKTCAVQMIPHRVCVGSIRGLGLYTGIVRQISNPPKNPKSLKIKSRIVNTLYSGEGALVDGKGPPSPSQRRVAVGSWGLEARTRRTSGCGSTSSPAVCWRRWRPGPERRRPSGQPAHATSREVSKQDDPSSQPHHRCDQSGNHRTTARLPALARSCADDGDVKRANELEDGRLHLWYRSTRIEMEMQEPPTKNQPKAAQRGEVPLRSCAQTYNVW